MSMPNIPNVTPDIDIDRDDAVNLLIASVAFEELALAHIVNAEAEKIQFVLGTLESDVTPPAHPTLDQLIELNEAVGSMLKKVIEKEIILSFKLEDAIKLLEMGDEDDDDHDD